MKKSFIICCLVSSAALFGVYMFARGGGGRGGSRGGSSGASRSSMRSSSMGRGSSSSRMSSRSMAKSSGGKTSMRSSTGSKSLARGSSKGITKQSKMKSNRASGSTKKSSSQVRASSKRMQAKTNQKTGKTARIGKTSQKTGKIGKTGKTSGRSVKRDSLKASSRSRLQQKAKTSGKVAGAKNFQKSKTKTAQRVKGSRPHASGKRAGKGSGRHSGRYNHYHNRGYHGYGGWRGGWGSWGPWGWWGPGFGWAFGVSLWAGMALGISAGYYPAWYWMYPYQTAVWGSYYTVPFATGLYYYPDPGYWYYSSMRAWYWPWFGCWYYPNMWTWYYPRVQVSVVSYVDKPQPYVVVDNDTNKDVYYAFYEREQAEDTVAFYRKGLVNKILATGSRKIFVPSGEADAYILVSRSQETLKDLVLQSDIDDQQNPLVLVDVSKTKKQTVEAKDLASKAEPEDARETEDLTLIREKIRAQGQEIAALSEKIDESIDSDKNAPEGTQEQEEQQIPESVPVPGKKPLMGKEPTAGKKHVKPVKTIKPVSGQESIEETAPAA